MASKMTKIFYILPRYMKSPSGGVKVINRHVEVLENNGFPAFLFPPPGIQLPDWLEKKSRVWEGDRSTVNRSDIIVYGEYSRPVYKSLLNSEKRPFSIYFCQNHTGFELVRKPYDGSTLSPPISLKNTDQIMVVSNISRKEIIKRELDVPITVISPDIQTELFFPRKKRRLISYMPRKRPKDAIEILEKFKLRFPHHADFEFYKINNLAEGKVAEVLGESEIFLSLNYREGLGLPPLEAMASGCVIVGFHGGGGKEYTSNYNGLWLERRDIEAYVSLLGKLCEIVKEAGPSYRSLLEHGYKTQKNFSTGKFESNLLSFWKNFSSRNSVKLIT